MFRSLFLFVLIAIANSAFVHPGLLVTDTDIERIKLKIEAQKEPWLSSWKKLTSIPFSQTSYTPNAVPLLWRPVNTELLWHDAAAAFNLAIRWKVTGDVEFADAAAAILTAWGGTLTSLGNTDDQYLTAGLQGYQLINAAELLRGYKPFSQSGLQIFVNMYEKVFLPLNIAFLKHEAASQHNVLHFFANWELGNIASVIAMGVLTDNQTLFDFGVDYYKTGEGNGAIIQAVSNLVEEPGTGILLGQGQESGRDQGHSSLCWQLLGAIAQQAWNQGEDLYGFDDNRFLKGAEYFARYNLGFEVPFEPYTNNIQSYTEISSKSRGAYRPTWELIYSHFVQIKGIDAPWTEKFRNYTISKMGGVFEGGAGSWGEGSGHYDGLGWGSLLHRLEEGDIVRQVSSLSSTTSTEDAVAPFPTITITSESFSQSHSTSPMSLSNLAATPPPISVSSTELLTPTSTPAPIEDTVVTSTIYQTMTIWNDCSQDGSCEL